MTKPKEIVYYSHLSQLLILALVVLTLALCIDVAAASSCLVGGLACLLPAWQFATRYFSVSGARQASLILKRFYLGEALKLALSMALLALAFKLPGVQAPYLFGGFIIVQLCLSLTVMFTPVWRMAWAQS